MTANIDVEIARLCCMPITGLRAWHRDLFGDDSRTGNREYLVRKIAWRLQSLAEGDLSERARRRAEELANDADLRTRPSTGRIATKKQGSASDEGRSPTPGTIITREYKGRRIVVTVLPTGFEHDGAVYKSLTAVVEAITGSHWNGRFFFGLKKGRRAK